jgi:hypothetical protein
MPQHKQKNRRYRNAKISEYKFKKVVMGFARRQTAGATARATKLSEPTVSTLYWRLREHLRSYPMFNFAPMIQTKELARAQAREAPNAPSKKRDPTEVWYDKVHHGGSTPEQETLLAIELISRAVTGNNYRYTERLKASSPRQMAKAKALYGIRNPFRKYSLIEILKPGIPDEMADCNTRPFAPTDYELTSVILVNERMADPEGSFFRYLWQSLLKHPL